MYLLGINNANELVFAEPELRENGKFSCCFVMVYPFVPEDNLDEVCQDYLEELDDGFKWHFCKEHDCKPSEMADELTWEEQLECVHDVSAYSNTVTCDDGNEWYFDTASLGQADPRTDEGGMKQLVISYTIFNNLMELWDKYHLRKLPSDEVDKYTEVIRELEDNTVNNEEDDIKNLIEKYIITCMC